MHIVLAIFFILHGIAHPVGFAGSWNLGEAGRKAHATTILGGRIALGERGIRALGLLWIPCALAFIAAAVLVFLGRRESFGVAMGAAIASAVMCILYWPAARIGLFLNLIIMALVIFRPGAPQ